MTDNGGAAFLELCEQARTAGVFVEVHVDKNCPPSLVDGKDGAEYRRATSLRLAKRDGTIIVTEPLTSIDDVDGAALRILRTVLS
jgi:hypothetical protein